MFNYVLGVFYRLKAVCLYSYFGSTSHVFLSSTHALCILLAFRRLDWIILALMAAIITILLVYYANIHANSSHITFTLYCEFWTYFTTLSSAASNRVDDKAPYYGRFGSSWKKKKKSYFTYSFYTTRCQWTCIFFRVIPWFLNPSIAPFYIRVCFYNL